ncbi:MAG: type II 3-dehydroquinate dehydratase [Corallococcus sp.]|nr:type II 3-dehydroquinate dehydratase [Corallococcus sp.]
MKILLLSGANLNMLGKRPEEHYGTLTLAQLEKQVITYGAAHGAKIICKHSNCEGKLIDILQSAEADAVILNAGAYTHYSYALRDCVECLSIPVIEVHLSDITAREDFRKTDVFDGVVAGKVYGKKEKGYFDAVDLALALKDVRKNIVFIGFAGAGKTSVGRLVAEKLGRKFYDTDEAVEQSSDKSIAEIFAVEGEKGFRRRESDAIESLPKNNCVISCGGGTVLSRGNMKRLSDSAVVVWLDVSAKIAFNRLSSCGKPRPLYDGKSFEEVEKIYAKRMPLYRKYADTQIDADGTLDDVTKSVTESLKIYGFEQ